MATDLHKSSYPTYADKIKTKDDFIQRTLLGINRLNEEVLGFVYKNELIRLVHFFFIEEDKYLQLISFQSDEYSDVAMAELLSYIDMHYGDYDLFFGFPKENKSAINTLKMNDFFLQEESYHQVLLFKNYHLKDEEEFVEITHENYIEFEKMHRLIEGDMYWNSQRILTNINSWNIYLCYENGNAIGSIYFIYKDKMMEIFGIDYLDNLYNENVFKKLIIKALNEGKKNGMDYLVFFTDQKMKEYLTSLGFVYVSKYCLLCKKDSL
ncbi:MAG: hypothetical protein R3Y57_06775 [Erysipelotrichaceae bacterium]